jgi:hypothetical protein
MLKRRKLPAQLRPTLDRDERVVAWASTSDGGAVVATNLGLWLPGRPDRLGWHEIHKVHWDTPTMVVTPAEPVGSGDGYVVMADAPAEEFSLDDAGDLPPAVRQRVTRSVAYTRHQTLPSGGGVRVVARRVTGANGVIWHVRYDQGTDADDPEVADATAAFVAEAAEAGGEE